MNFNSNNYSTKDNTRITGLNAANQSGILSEMNGGIHAFNSNFTLKELKQEQDKPGSKPPLIPSLKAKIY